MLALVDDVVGRSRAEGADDPQATADSAARLRQEATTAPPIDAEVLLRLTTLGGEEFVTELADSFQSEARARLADLRDSVAQQDVARFRDGAHAICSIAVNFGAKPLAELCAPFQTISGHAVDSHGRTYLDQIAAELDRVSAALARRAEEQGAPKPG